jgi:nitroimidazol reductase NimA-like FMN-containing flavoprotein (pyridoxamine 5'-phosphate oxidase superfamily)
MRRKDRQITGRDEIEEIIKSSDVCRIALTDDNIPYIVTMNFGYMGGEKPCFYFHSAKEGRKIDMIRKNGYVCFELDTGHELYSGDKGCDWGMRFSSVVGYGNISIVDDLTEKISGLDCIMAHYADTGSFIYEKNIFDRTTVIRLDIEEMTGKRKT